MTKEKKQKAKIVALWVSIFAISLFGCVLGVKALVTPTTLTIQNVENFNYGGQDGNLGAFISSGSNFTDVAVANDLTVAGVASFTGTSTYGVVSSSGASYLNGGVRVGTGGTLLDLVASQVSTTIDFAAITAGTCAEKTFTLTGASTGDPVALSVSSTVTGDTATWMAYVSAANTVAIRGCNVSSTASTADFVASPFRVTVFSN